jgi:Lipocalin-like domain
MRHSLVVMTAVFAVLGITVMRDKAFSQQDAFKEQLLGAWELVSFNSVHTDGSKLTVFGGNPNGIAFFDRTGHYIITVMRSDRAKFAANDRAQGTADENKATAVGTITYFGTYTVSEPDRTLNIHVVGSSFPNWNGTDQKRSFAVSADELKLTNPIASTGGTTEVVWKRAK